MSDVWEVVRRGLGAPAEAEVEEVEIMVEEPTAPVEEDAQEDGDDETDIPPVASTSNQTLPLLLHAAPETFPRNFRTTPQTRRLLGSAFAYLVRKARSASGGVEGELEQLMRMMVEDVVALEESDDGNRASRGRGAKGRGKGRGNGRGQEAGSSKMLAEGLVWTIAETCRVRLSCSHLLRRLTSFRRLRTASCTLARLRS